MKVVPIKNGEAIEELEKLRHMLLSGEATKFYAFTDVEDIEEAVIYGGDWDMSDVVAALGTLQSWRLKRFLMRFLFSLMEKMRKRTTPRSSPT